MTLQPAYQNWVQNQEQFPLFADCPLSGQAPACAPVVLWVVVVPFSTCHFPESSGGSSFIIRLPGGERWISGSQGLLKEEYLHCRNTLLKSSLMLPASLFVTL